MSEPRRKTTDPPERGDVVEVRWVDILEDPSGDPDKAELARRSSFGIYWTEREDEGVPVLITTTTLDDPDLSHQQGFCIYPRAVVQAVKVIRRARRRRSSETT